MQALLHHFFFIQYHNQTAVLLLWHSLPLPEFRTNTLFFHHHTSEYFHLSENHCNFVRRCIAVQVYRRLSLSLSSSHALFLHLSTVLPLCCFVRLYLRHFLPFYFASPRFSISSSLYFSNSSSVCCLDTSITNFSLIYLFITSTTCASLCLYIFKSLRLFVV